jgi:dienelactone hydrolase
MDVTGSMLQLNISDGKMEAYEARPKDSGSYPGICG